jgi:20S proteasome alpha/beta subunit
MLLCCRCAPTEKQECTQSYIRRPYGVGLLVAGVDVRARECVVRCEWLCLKD